MWLHLKSASAALSLVACSAEVQPLPVSLPSWQPGHMLQHAEAEVKVPEPPCTASVPCAAARGHSHAMASHLPAVAASATYSMHAWGRSIICDPYLRVRGGGGSIYALGDAATIAQPRALEHAQVACTAAHA